MVEICHAYCITDFAASGELLGELENVTQLCA